MKGRGGIEEACRSKKNNARKGENNRIIAGGEA